MCSSADKEDGDRHVMLCGVMTKLKQVQKSANDVAIPTK